MKASLDSMLHKVPKGIGYLSAYKVIHCAMKKKFKGKMQWLFMATFISNVEDRICLLFGS